jgi:hypothetical protein
VRWVAPAIGLAVVAALALVLVLLAQTGDRTGSAAQPARSTNSSGGTTQAPPAQPTAPSSRASTPGRATSGAPAPTGRSGQRGGSAQSVPAGFVRHRDATGFSVVVPAGWQPVRSGALVEFREPGGGRFLRIDQSDSPNGDPVTDWQRQEAVVSQRLPGYRLLRPITRVDYRGWAAADWEFTWNSGGTTVHVLNRNIVPSPTKAYALYWSVPDSQWASSRGIFDVAAGTFQPAT